MFGDFMVCLLFDLLLSNSFLDANAGIYICYQLLLPFVVISSSLDANVGINHMCFVYIELIIL